MIIWWQVFFKLATKRKDLPLIFPLKKMTFTLALIPGVQTKNQSFLSCHICSVKVLYFSGQRLAFRILIFPSFLFLNDVQLL